MDAVPPAKDVKQGSIALIGLEYEIVPTASPDECRVEAISYKAEGIVYVTIFSGTDAKERAKEYTDWKNFGASLTDSREPTTVA